MNKINDIIEKAIEHYPISVQYRGRFTPDEINELEKYCSVQCFSVYMDGTCTYSIRKRNKDMRGSYNYEAD